jgi:uncharacterized membrane protein
MFIGLVGLTILYIPNISLSPLLLLAIIALGVVIAFRCMGHFKK